MVARARTAACLVLLATSAVAPRPAAAAEPSPESPPVTAPDPSPRSPPASATSAIGAAGARGTWFGWQVMLADAGAIGLLAGGGALTSSSSGFAFLPILGGITYFAGGPLVHALHDDPGGAGRSIALRLVVPIATGGVFAALAALTSSSGTSDVCYPHDQRTCAAIFGAAVGIGVGMIGAMVVDWITSSEPAPTFATHRRIGDDPGSGAAPPRWALLPVALRGGPGLAIAGTF